MLHLTCILLNNKVQTFKRNIKLHLGT